MGIRNEAPLAIFICFLQARVLRVSKIRRGTGGFEISQQFAECALASGLCAVRLGLNASGFARVISLGAFGVLCALAVLLNHLLCPFPKNLKVSREKTLSFLIMTGFGAVSLGFSKQTVFSAG